MQKEKPLTARQAQFMKPEDRRVEVPAGPPKGLYLVVQPSGAKSWAFRYRWRGKPRKYTLKDPYPVLKLAAARAEAEALVEDLKQGVDPAASEPVPEPDPDLLSAVVEEYLFRYFRPRARTSGEIERILEREAVSRWGNRPITEIGRADVLRALDEIVDRGSEAMANKTLRVLRRFFGWCIERGLREDSPVDRLKAPAAEQSRDRVLTPEELAEVWKASHGLGYPFGPLVHLLILTAQRRGEVAAMRWREVDLRARLWTLPKESVKAGRAHDVPLAPAAVELLESLPRFAQGDFVMTTTSGLKPVNGFSKAKTRIDEAILKARKEVAERRGEDPERVELPPRWTMHDLRRTAATHMARANVPPHVLAALLNHSPGRTLGISAIYIRHRYLAERREALDAWADYVRGLVKSKERREAV